MPKNVKDPKGKLRTWFVLPGSVSDGDETLEITYHIRSEMISRMSIFSNGSRLESGCGCFIEDAASYLTGQQVFFEANFYRIFLCVDFVLGRHLVQFTAALLL